MPSRQLAVVELAVLLLAGCGTPSVASHRVDGVTYFTYTPTGPVTDEANVVTGSFSIQDGCVGVHLTPTGVQGHTAILVDGADLSGDESAISVGDTSIPLNGQEVEFVANDVSARGLDNLDPCPALSVPVWNLWTHDPPT